MDLRGTAGFLVADARGRVVGRVEGPMYGSSAETPVAAIGAIDDRAKVIGPRVDREMIGAFV